MIAASASRGARVLPGLCALCVAMILSQFFRQALGAVAPEVARDLSIDADGLGALGAAWFLSFAVMQLPVGVALDRYGPKRTVAVLMIVAAVGCVLFARAEGLLAGVVAQALIGIGCAPIFMGTLVVLARWYPVSRFAILSSSFIAISNIGNIIGTTPLAAFSDAFGWRLAFLVLAVLVLVSSAAVALLVRDTPPEREAAAPETLARVVQGVLDVMRLRALWPILPMTFMAYATVVTIRGLWAGPYVSDVYGLDAIARGNVLLAIALIMAVVPVLYASLERRLDRRRELVLTGSGVTCVGLFVLGVRPDAGLAVCLAVLLASVASGLTYTLLIAQGRRFLADHQVGRGLTLLNTSVFLGSAFLQASSGWVLEAARTRGIAAADAYGWMFVFLATCLAISLAIYTRSRDVRLSE